MPVVENFDRGQPTELPACRRDNALRLGMQIETNLGSEFAGRRLRKEDAVLGPPHGGAIGEADLGRAGDPRRQKRLDAPVGLGSGGLDGRLGRSLDLCGFRGLGGGFLRRDGRLLGLLRRGASTWASAAAASGGAAVSTTCSRSGTRTGDASFWTV